MQRALPSACARRVPPICSFSVLKDPTSITSASTSAMGASFTHRRAASASTSSRSPNAIARRAPDAAALSLALALRAGVAGLRAVLAIHRGLTPLHHREIEVALTDPHLSKGAPEPITIDYPHFAAVMVDQLAQRVARALASRRLVVLGRPAVVLSLRES